MYEFVTKDGVERVAESELLEWFAPRINEAGEPVDPITQKENVQIKANEDETFTWVLSDDTLDRDREIIDPRGWDLKAFKANPVVIWAHASGGGVAESIPAIGKMTSIKRKENALVGKIQFDEHGMDPLAENIAAKVRNGFLNTGSVGFRVLKIEFQEDDPEVRAIITKAELFEFSIVNIPSNPQAVVQRSMPDEGPTMTFEAASASWRRHFDTIAGVDSASDELLDSETGVAGKHYTSTLYDEDREDRKTSDHGDRKTSGTPDAQDQRGNDLDALFVSDAIALEDIFNGN